MRHRALMRFYQPFPAAIPLYEAGYPRVTHPSATKWIFRRISTPFDLHVLSTPPAFILSQDQTLMFKCLIVQKLQLAVISSRFTLVFVLKNSFGIFGIVLLFSFQSSFVTFYRSDLFILSDSQAFVNNFSKLFSKFLFHLSCFRCSRWQLVYITTQKKICQQLFYKYY